MSSEENYLNDLLKSLSGETAEENIVSGQDLAQNEEFVLPEESAIIDKSALDDSVAEQLVVNEPVVEEPITEESIIEEPIVEKPIILDEISLDTLELPEVPDIELPDLDIKLENDLSSLELSEISDIPDFFDKEPETAQIEQPETGEELKSEDVNSSETVVETEEVNLEDIELPELSELSEISAPEEEFSLENIELPELSMPEEEPNLENIELPELSEISVPEELTLENIELPELSEISELEEELNLEDIETQGMTEAVEELNLPDIDLQGMLDDEPAISQESEISEQPDLENTELPETDTEPVIEDPVIPEQTESEQTTPEVSEEESGDSEIPTEEPTISETEDFKVEDIEMSDFPEIPEDEPLLQDELNIDGLDEAIQSETELEMAGELNLGELDFGEDASVLGASMDLQDDALGLSDDLSMLQDDAGEEASDGMDNSLEDVLNMLDDDAELAEINDMLKKSDNNEPIQDDMMDILNQMADDEAASVNAGVKHVDDEDDGGVPLPVIPPSVLNPDSASAPEEVPEDDGKKKKGKKESKKKKKGDTADKDAGGAKEPGKMGKLFNMLTEELVPEPTEEELAAEKEAKAAKKQEALTKKEEEKLAKEEEKKAKAEEKAAADKAKAEAAAQKKKEKQAAKEAKLAAKRAKEAAAGPKKRIPPKKIAAAAVFGATVGGAVILATNVLSTQGYLQTARNAYYDEDYKTVYQSMFGMELDDTASDGLIQARSEVLLTMQRRYDSYQNNLKMGREIEALDALLQGLATYDFINADAEKYGVAAEVESIKSQILDTLAAKYDVDESQARALINNEDALSYTIALDDIISAH